VEKKNILPLPKQSFLQKKENLNFSAENIVGLKIHSSSTGTTDVNPTHAQM